MLLRSNAALLVLCLCAAAASAGDRYYMLIFGSQRERPNPNYSHSFATFVHTCEKCEEDSCPETIYFEEFFTISWLPVTGKVRVGALHSEPGRNYELHETIAWAYASCQRISLWGPYEIEQDLYCQARRQFALLNSGQVSYKADDSFHRTNRVSNCIHAVSSAEEGYRLRVASPSWGQTASYLIARVFERWIIDPTVRYEWVSTALGLDQYPLIYRELENPRSNVLWYTLGLFVGGTRR